MSVNSTCYNTREFALCRAGLLLIWLHLLLKFDCITFDCIIVWNTQCGFTVECIVFCPQVKNWVKELRKMLGNEICLCIVGE